MSVCVAHGTIITRNWKALLGFHPAARITERRVLLAFQHLAKIHPAKLPKLVLAKKARVKGDLGRKYDLQDNENGKLERGSP